MVALHDRIVFEIAAEVHGVPAGSAGCCPGNRCHRDYPFTFAPQLSQNFASTFSGLPQSLQNFGLAPGCGVGFTSGAAGDGFAAPGRTVPGACFSFATRAALKTTDVVRSVLIQKISSYSTPP